MIDADELEMMEPEMYEEIVEYHIEKYVKGRVKSNGG